MALQRVKATVASICLKEPEMKCQRCRCETRCTIMSIFNTQIICLGCHRREQQHPKYSEARAAELAALRAGERNFPGIGKPPDL